MNRRIVTIAVGEPKYMRAAKQLAETVDRVCGLPVDILAPDLLEGMNAFQMSRCVKTQLLRRLPIGDQLLYLDGDCLVYGDPTVGFDLLEDGWDVVMTYSFNQEGLELFWHVDRKEVDNTLLELGFSPIQLQGGMMFVRRSAAAEALFDEWHREWDRFRGKDQAALVRALMRSPARVFLLGHAFLNGPVIGHRFGLFGRSE